MIGANQLMAPLQPGAYNATFTDTASDNGCDPSQDICEEWLPGNYTVDVGELASLFPGEAGLHCAVCFFHCDPFRSSSIPTAICNGMCGSNHPHSQIYDTGDGQFEITGRN